MHNATPLLLFDLFMANATLHLPALIIILKIVQKSLDRNDFYPPKIKGDYIPIIAWVPKGHATEFFEETIQYFQKNPATPLNRPVRGELLASLLLIADELDLQNKRVSFSETAKFNLSDFSAVHWFKTPLCGLCRNKKWDCLFNP